MFKNLMIVLMFIISTFIGFSIGEKYRRRSSNLKEVQKGLMLLNSEIIYANTPLPDALYGIGKKLTEPISYIFMEMAESLELGQVESVFHGFEKAYEAHKDEVNLTNEDYKVVSDFFKTLGFSGVTGQDRMFNLVLDNIDMNYKEAKKLEKENIKLYRALGLSIGAMLAIFFI